MNGTSLTYPLHDTICALATAPVAAGVAVIRLSGPQAFAALASLGLDAARLTPRHAALRTLSSPEGTALDHALVLTFPNPASFTGEDVVELHTHGSMAVVQAILAILINHAGLRQALPGEFTRRAVLNGKMDLTQAEGLADLISATTAAQHRQALRQLDGALGQRFEDWRTRILDLLAQTEAAIDFPDEELDILADAALRTRMESLRADLQTAVAERAGERLRDGLRLAIVGRPNAGKSTLLNLLSGRDVAIVSPLAGTTRDVVTSQLDIAGVPVTLADTAGLRDTDDVIEAEGIRRARAQAASADLIIAVIDSTDALDAQAQILAELPAERTLIIHSKADLTAPTTTNGLALNLTAADALANLLPPLEAMVRTETALALDAALLTRARHRQAVTDAIHALTCALAHLTNPPPGLTSFSELMAQDLRDAAAAIGSVTGRTGTEDVLDVVFSTFCIGK